jgi:hypothetical protein
MTSEAPVHFLLVLLYSTTTTQENNLFVGARPRYWECAENWESSDGTAAKAAPCGKDRAFFRKNHFYSTVQSNASTVTVQYLQVRGQLVTTELIPSQCK